MTFEAQLADLRSETAPLPFDAWAELDDPERAANILARDGCVVIPNFLDRAAVLAATARVSADLEKYLPRIREFSTTEQPEYIINCRQQRFANYRELADAHKPVFNIRNAWGEDAPDAGLIDLFHPGRLFPNLQPLIEELVTGCPPRVLSYLPKLTGGPRYVPKQCNCYINLGVTGTRGFHIDADIPNIKAFLYLTDVLRMEDGPYCYVPGSHREQLIKSVNKRYNVLAGHRETDMHLTDPADGVAFLAPAGTLILTFQSGIHRGYPQAANARRLALVQLFTPAS